MTLRLAVTQEQAATVRLGVDGLSAARCVLRLPERPTMPCPECDGRAGRQHTWSDDLGIRHAHWVDCGRCRGTGDPVPIPEGTEVRIEYPCPECDISGRGTLDGRPQDWLVCGECRGEGSVPVASAILAHVATRFGESGWTVTLTNLKPIGDDQ